MTAVVVYVLAVVAGRLQSRLGKERTVGTDGIDADAD